MHAKMLSSFFRPVQIGQKLHDTFGFEANPLSATTTTFEEHTNPDAGSTAFSAAPAPAR
jgi:hypothetical protein